MNTNIKYLSALLLLLLIGFVTACEKENIDSMEPGMEEEFPVDTLFCDLEFELFFFSGGIPVEIIMIDSLTGGTAPFYYSWNTGDTTETLTVTTPGSRMEIARCTRQCLSMELMA